MAETNEEGTCDPYQLIEKQRKEIQTLREENARLTEGVAWRDRILKRILDTIDDMDVCQDFTGEKSNQMLFIKRLSKSNCILQWKKDTMTSPLHIREYWAPGSMTSYTLTPLHLAAGKSYGKPVRQLILLANKSGEIDIPDILGRSPLFYAARCMNLELINALLENGASPHLLDYSGRTCLEFAATAVPMNAKSSLMNETLTRLINAMKEKPISEEVKSINKDILAMRSHHSLSEKARELANCTIVRERRFFTLYCEIRQTDRGEWVLHNPSYSVLSVVMSPEAKFSQYQLFQNQKLLLLAYELPKESSDEKGDVSEDDLVSWFNNALANSSCLYHCDHRDPSFNYGKLRFFDSIPLACTANGCAMSILFSLLQKLQGHPISYLFDNSQGGIYITVDGTEEKIVRSKLDSRVCSLHVQWFGS